MTRRPERLAMRMVMLLSVDRSTCASVLSG
jgi:hypothetical protein